MAELALGDSIPGVTNLFFGFTVLQPWHMLQYMKTGDSLHLRQRPCITRCITRADEVRVLLNLQRL